MTPASKQCRQYYKHLDRRIAILTVLILVAQGILVMRLWSLQIVHGEENRQLAEAVRLQPQRVEARRGVIYGYNGDDRVVLADNRPAYDLVLTPAHCEDTDQVCALLEDLVSIDPDALMKKIENSDHAPFKQIVVKEDITKNELMRVEEYAYLLRGIYTNVRPERRYPYRETAGQIIGYLNEIDRDELKQRADRYTMGDYIGRRGLEAEYEPVLKGRDGLMTVVVYANDQRPQTRTDAYGNPYFAFDSYGRKLQEVTSRRLEAVSGNPVYTSLDIELQDFCEGLLEGELGGIVVLDPRDGAVLALASNPNYDPSVFVTQGLSRQRTELLNKKPSPMRNRCYQEIYPPGSVFKVMLAAAALEEQLVSEDNSFYCPGHFQIEGRGRKWACWKKYGHGQVNVVDALAYSCDVFFYNVGLKLGVDTINKYAAKMGLAGKTGLDLPGEAPGLIPSREWLKQLRQAQYPDKPWEWRWYPGHTVNLSIGQGAAATTPLQTAVMMSTVLNGGRRVQPHLREDTVAPPSEPFLSPKTLDIIRKGMRKCVEKETYPTGTAAQYAKIPGKVVLGKTGTAQVAALAAVKGMKEEDIPYELRDHAWFVAGVPDEDPPIAVAVLVEHGLHGSSTAAPLAKQVIEYYYGRDQGPQRIAKKDSSL